MADMVEENNIDLHADTDDLNLFNLKLERFEADDPPDDPEMEALFDSVVTSRGSIEDEVIKTEKELTMTIDKAGEECPVTEGPGSSEIPPSVHKFGVLVGNLTWWTTDLDVENVLRAIGVDDVIDIKFIDNRTNGQSKGYCSVQVGSDRSIRLIHDRLPKRELHDREIMVAAPSKIATAQFESQSDCKPRLPPANMGPAGCNPRNSMLPPPGLSAPPQPYGIPPPPLGAPRAGGPRPSRSMNGSDVNSPSGPRMMNMGHPHQRPAPPPMPQHHLNYGPPPPRPHGLPFHPHNARPVYRPHHQPGHPPYSFPLPPSMDHRGPLPPRPEWMHNGPGPQHCPPVNNQLSTHCPPGAIGHPPTEMNLGSPPGPPPLNDGPPAPHVNPAFFQSPYSSSPTMPVPIQDGPPSKVPLRSRDNPQKITTYVPHDRPSEDRKPPPPEIDRFPVLNPILSEAEIGEGLSRNRSVSSSAISRAVTDAAKGDFPSAIETLVTAISLIKQSRVGNDDRSKILVTSLQDTLHGIESKSYGRFRDGHRRSHTRSRSRDRACGGYRSRHSHHHYRSRSRSRGRSRSRDHYHRERRRSRSLSSSRGREFERSSKFDDRDRYREQEQRERERHKREHERERESGGRGIRVSGSTRNHEDSEHQEHRSSRR